ncbi:MAG TPA: PaaI family thioesterase [Candidatus Baltobacteraceae bacterium]|nr:PaaI family thioesterase [Candidatus Baltobacteraceae bacterium]
MEVTLAVQERHAPHSVCYGCGPANPDGLHLRSFEVGEELVADWQPTAGLEAFAGALNGGICGLVLDCHANWAAALGLMRSSGADRPPATVTARYEVQLLRPTPTDRPLRLRARVVSIEGHRAVADAEIVVGHEVTATFRGTFVAVAPGHPAYHRWDP